MCEDRLVFAARTVALCIALRVGLRVGFRVRLRVRLARLIAGLLLVALLRALLLLRVAIGDLVVYQVVQRDHRPHQRGEVDDQHLVVGLHVGGLHVVLRTGVRQQIEDVLQQVDDVVVDRQLVGDHKLQVVLDLVDLRVQALQAAQLVGDALRERAQRRVLDVAQQMLYTDLFGLLGADLAEHVLERLAGRRAVVVHLLHSVVRLGGQAEILRLRVDHDEHRVRAVLSNQIVDGNIALMQLRSGVVPADDSLFGVHLLEHRVHRLQVVVVEEPDRFVSVIFVERYCVGEEQGGRGKRMSTRERPVEFSLRLKL